jgi:antitoxin HicB
VKKADQHTGSTFDSFLEEEGILDEVEGVAAKRVIAWQIAHEMEAQHITKHAMAQTLGTSRSQVDRLLDPKNASVYLTTLTRAAKAVGMRVAIGLVPAVGRIVSVNVQGDAVRVSSGNDGRSSDVARQPLMHAKRQRQNA